MDTTQDQIALELAKEINQFVRTKTTDPLIAIVALGAASMTISFVPLCFSAPDQSESLLPTDSPSQSV